MATSKTVAGLNVELGMNTAVFIKDIEKAEKNIKSFGAKSNKVLAKMDKAYKKINKSITNFAKSFFSLKSIMVQVAGAAGFGLLINKALEVGDNIAKTADSIGIATDALQEYRFAGDLAGVANEKLDKAFQKVAKSVGEAQANTGTLVTLLNKTDKALLHQIQTSTSTAEAIDLLFTAMDRYESHTKRAALANAAFGRSGVDMLVMVKNGKKELDAARQAAQDYGLVIEERLLRDSEKAKDQLSILGSILKKKLVVAILEAAPTIAKLAESMINAIPSVVEFTESVVEVTEKLFGWVGVVSDAARAVGEWMGNMTGVSDVQGEFANELEKTEAQIQSLERAVESGMAKNSEVIQKRITELKAYRKTMQEALAPVNQSFPEDAPQSTPGAPTGTGSNAAEDAARKAQEELQKELERQEAAQKRYNELKSKGAALTQQMRTETEIYNDTLIELKAMLDQNIISQETYNRAVDKASKKFQEANVEGQALDSTFREIDSALAGNMDSWRDWGQAVIRIIQDVIQQQLQMGQTSGSGKSSLFGSLSSIISAGMGFFGGGGAAPTQSGFTVPFKPTVNHTGGSVGSGARKAVDPSVFIGANKYHNGGLVGDEVPIIAKKGERVLTEEQQKMYGGTKINYNIDARGASVEAVERIKQALDEMNNSFDNRAVAAVTHERYRNPNIF